MSRAARISLVCEPVVIVDARMCNRTGIGRYVSDILRYARDYGTEYPFAVVALCGPADRCVGRFGVPRLETRSAVFSIGEHVAIPRIVAKVKPRLLHFPQFNVPVLLRSPIVVTVHDCAFDLIPDDRPSRLAYMYYRAMMGVALRKATKIIAVSHATRHDLVNLYNIDENKIVVIHRGIDIDYFRGAEDDNAAWNQVRTAFGLAGPYALYVGLVRPRKNVRRLLAAVRRLRDRIGTGFRLVMVGPTDSRFLNVAGEAAALGISDIVIQTGEVSDKILRALYRHASLVVLPSLLEGFGLPILEGMASGVPIVASDIPAHREVAGNAALLFPPHDVEALYETMYRVLTDSELADSLRARGRQAVESFSWEVCARRTFELYGEIIT